MATKARQQYFADEQTLQKQLKEFSIQDDVREKIEGIEEGAQVNTIETIKVNGTEVTPDEDKAIDLTIPGVIDNLSSTSSTDALSARQGKILYDKVTDVSHIGHFLALWDASTGLPVTDPEVSPYTYNSGDFYTVSVVASQGGTNYKPSGTEYISGQASTDVETDDIEINDFYFYDGTSWRHMKNSGAGAIAIDGSLSTTSANPVENRVITQALNNKADDTDVNTKTFYLSSTDDLTTAQEAIDWYRAGNNPIINYNKTVYSLNNANSAWATFNAGNYFGGGNTGVTQYLERAMEFTMSNRTVTSVSNFGMNAMHYLDTSQTQTSPFIPTHDWQPATKKYVDDNAGVTYTAGANIQISSANVISATDTTYTAGTGISIDANNVISNTQTSAERGNITGTLSNQTDLQTALNAKATDADVVHIAGAETITGQKTFQTTTDGNYWKFDGTNATLYSPSASGYLYVTRGGTTPVTMAIKSGTSGGTFGTTTNHQFEFRTNDTARMTIQSNSQGGKVVLASGSIPAAGANDSTVPSTSWVQGEISSAVSGGVSDVAYGSSWNGVTNIAPSKNAVYDKIETVISSIPTVPTNVSAFTNDAGYLTSATGVTSVNGNHGAVTVTEFSPTNTGSTGNVLTKTASGYNWAAPASQVSDTAYASSWNGVTTTAPSKNAVYDKISAMDTTISGKQDTISDLATIRSGAALGATALQSISSSDVTTALGYTPANDSNVVKTSGNQTIAGTKTFSTSPVVPSKTSNATNTGTAIATEAQVYKKQDTLVSGTNIKTINGTSLLGSGDITISAPTYTAGTGIDITNDVISVDSTVALANDVNTKTFYLSSTSDLTTAQAAYDWFLAGKTPIIRYGDKVYVCHGKNRSGGASPSYWLDFNTVRVGEGIVDDEDYLNPSFASEDVIRLTYNNSTNVVTQVSNVYINRQFLPANSNTQVVYTPSRNWDPATKKYVDDSIAAAGGGDMNYSDFNATTVTGATVTMSLNTTITPSANFTVNAPSEIKDGQIYMLRVTNGATAYTMTLGTNMTNPYGSSLALTANGVDQFVFLATGGNLELQPDIDLSSKQDVLVSGTNIKTVNSTSLLGSGNISINAVPSGGTTGQILTKTSSGYGWAAAPAGGLQKASNSPLDIQYFWAGTQAQYDALSSYDNTTVYLTV